MNERLSSQEKGPVSRTELHATRPDKIEPPSGIDDEVESIPDLFADPGWARVVKRFELTQRQAEVAGLMCRGCQDKEIARLMGLTSHGIRRHVRELFKKLDVDRRIGIVLRLVLAIRPPSRRAH